MAVWVAYTCERCTYRASAVAVMTGRTGRATAKVGSTAMAGRVGRTGGGATGVPGALWFNLGAFVLPGGLLLLQAHLLRKAVQEASWRVRLGLTLMQLSALAFAMQGLLPLDQRGVDAAASRLHVLMWMLWWIAFVPGALLLALGLLRQRRGLAVVSAAVGVLVPLLAVWAPIGAWVGLAQRLAFVLWFGGWLLVSRCLIGTSASAPKSLPPAGR